MNDSLLVDTNIVIYALQGIPHVNKLLEQRKIYVSFITEIELYSWPGLNDKDNQLIEDFLNSCRVVEYSSRLKQQVIEVRKKFKLKMSDAFIAASAIQNELPLVSADAIFSKLAEINFLKVNL